MSYDLGCSSPLSSHWKKMAGKTWDRRTDRTWGKPKAVTMLSELLALRDSGESHFSLLVPCILELWTVCCFETSSLQTWVTVIMKVQCSETDSLIRIHIASVKGYCSKQNDYMWFLPSSQEAFFKKQKLLVLVCVMHLTLGLSKLWMDIQFRAERKTWPQGTLWWWGRPTTVDGLSPCPCRKDTWPPQVLVS